MCAEKHLDQSSPSGRILAVIAQVLAERGIDEADVTPDESFRGTFGLDSLEMADLVLDLEAAFSIEIPDDDLKRMRTVQEAIDYVRGALAYKFVTSVH